MDKGPLARDAATHIEHCVRSIYSSSGAASFATLAVSHSAVSVGEAWNRVTTSVWWPVVETREWNCGTQCEMWGLPLVCLFHNPILVNIVAAVELGLGIHNPRFVAGPLEVGLETGNSRFVAWLLELGLGTRSPRFVAWPLELGLRTRNARSTMINRSTVLRCIALCCQVCRLRCKGLVY